MFCNCESGGSFVSFWFRWRGNVWKIEIFKIWSGEMLDAGERFEPWGSKYLMVGNLEDLNFGRLKCLMFGIFEV